MESSIFLLKIYWDRLPHYRPSSPRRQRDNVQERGKGKGEKREFCRVKSSYLRGASPELTDSELKELKMERKKSRPVFCPIWATDKDFHLLVRANVCLYRLLLRAYIQLRWIFGIELDDMGTHAAPIS